MNGPSKDDKRTAETIVERWYEGLNPEARSLISGHDLAKLRLDITYALARSVTPHQED